MRLFKGLSAFPITPADPAGRVDVDDLARLLDRLAAAGVDSVGLLGSTGTYAYLDRTERARTVRAAAEVLARRTPLIVGVGALRTDAAVALAQDAAAAGADGLLLAPVSYTPLTDEEVFQHVVAVAAATELPLCLYNNPSTTHFTFGDALIGRLAAVPRVVAVKNPAPLPHEAGERVAALRSRVPTSFSIGYSADWHAPEAVLAGGEAWYSVVGGLLPGPALRLMRAAQAADAAEVGRLNAALEPLWALFRQFGSVRVVFAAANLMGLTAHTLPRPLLPLGGPERDRVADVLAGLDRGLG